MAKDESAKGNWFVRHKVITAILAILVLGVIFSTAGDDNSSSSTSAGSKQDTASKEPEDTHPHFGDGTHEIGKDIQPGTYRTRQGSAGCYYARLSGFGGSLGEIIANDNADGPVVVTIDASDKGFTSTRCGTWTQNLTAITESQTSFGDGIFIVGTDMQAGAYKSSGRDSCYYSRLSGFGGVLGDIISNNNTDSQAIITIEAGDKGFKSSRCGTWTKSS